MRLADCSGFCSKVALNASKPHGVQADTVNAAL